MACSQRFVRLVLAVLFCCTILVNADSCQVSIEQTSQLSWERVNREYTAVEVLIKNVGSSTVTSVTLDIDGRLDSVWQMVKINGDYVLPTWRKYGGIKVDDHHTWGYIVKSDSQATISIKSINCAGSGPSPTNAPTATPTEAPTSAPSTNAPTKLPTSAPTKVPTSAPTKAPTSAPTKAPTSAPTKAPTSAPTKTPTTTPTKAPSSAPTKAPTNPPSTGGRLCPAGSIWSPTPGTTWQWQLTGSIDQSIDVQMYDIDLFDNSASVIASLHSKGRAVICYFSTQYEDWRPDASKFTSNILGSNLDDWPGERYVDIRSPVLRSIMTARLDLAVSKGCDGVEPDNVDEYTNKNGLGITAADQISFNSFLAQEAHKRGLSVGLKNDLDQVDDLVSHFDWALNEQCNQYSECSSLRAFTAANKAVFGVEYSGTASKFCPSMVTDKFSWLLKDLNLGAKITQCCTYASGGCAAKAAYSCVKAPASRAVYEDTELELVSMTPVETKSSAASTVYPTVFVVAAVLALLF